MSDNGTEVPRLTPTQRLHEVTMQALTRRGNPPETISGNRNAKGDWQPEINVVAQDGETSDELYERWKALALKAEDDFPLSRTQVYERNNEPPARVKGPK